ncbi:MAG: bifunctional phosphopantothenoylcysteine decarboxylase/phosphopantothenate--cysteine ligase CoaBC [bacterium]
MLSGKKIVIGITGGIAAYKIPSLIRLLVREGAEVRVIMTPAAKDFVTPLTLATLSRNNVILHPFDHETGAWNSHVELGQWADLMLFAPVTANTLGKMSHGIADNFLVTTYLSAKCPVMIAPAMDLDMFQHPTTQQNMEILRSFGNILIAPQVGELASGLSGPGRMEEPEKLLDSIRDFFFQRQTLKGKKVLVTAGPTYEKIDAVRFIGNFSSGQMGFALAEEAVRRGGAVTLISGPVALSIQSNTIHRVNVESAEEMFQQCKQFIAKSDILLMAAAVADYTIDKPSPVKEKKKGKPYKLTLSPTVDILAALGKRKKKNQCFVGFALETDDELINARKKLENKRLDLIVLNSLRDQGAGFGVPTNKVTILTRSGKTYTGQVKPKSEIAKDIITAVVTYLNSNKAS